MATETTKKKITKTTKKGATAKKTAVVKDKAQAVSAKVEEKSSAAVATVETKAKTSGVKKAALTMQEKFKRLSAWLALGYFVQALAIVILGSHAAAAVTSNYLAVDALASDANGHQVVAGAARHLFDVRLSWAVAAFLVLFAAIHFVFALAKPAWREKMLARGVNELRSLALAVGGGAMVLTLGLLVGITDVTLLVFLFAATAGAPLLVLATEVMAANNGGKETRTAHYTCVLAGLSGLLPWLALLGLVVSSLVFNGHVPVYLAGILASMFVLFALGASALHYRLERKGRWADAVYTERVLMILPFVTATALAWQVYAGVLHS